MKVQLFVSKDYEEAYAEIYTDVLTDNIQKAMHLLEEDEFDDEKFDLECPRCGFRWNDE